MPHLSGFEMCREMRASPRWQSTPVIFLTANITDADKLEAQQLAPAVIVLKPMAKEQLWQLIAQMLKLEPEAAPAPSESKYL
jgi:CheY-like chemotaxis protein